MMKQLRFAALLTVVLSVAEISAQDTVVVQTLTFDSITTRRGVWEFPPETENYRKILMYYTLKCDPQTQQDQYNCGEWDYLTYTNVFDHTGVLDSTLSDHPEFMVGALAPDSITLVNSIIHDRVTGYRYERVIDNTINETDHIVGSSGTTEDLTFHTSTPMGRSQYLFSAAELTAAGLSAGDIDKLRFNVQIAGGEIKELKIRLKHSSLTELTAFVDDNFTTHFHNDWTIPGTGVNTVVLTEPFNWDGTSAVLVDLSYANNSGNGNTTVYATDSGSDMAVNSSDQDGYLSFDDDHVSVDVDGFANISTEITISFWQYGDPDVQPINNYIFEGLNADNQRVLNVHLPWSNERIYWDAGNDGGSYDRIDKLATTANFEGQWNHWAFTKNSVTGIMRIYLNGSLWHSGSNKFWDMDGITKFRIGSNGNGTGGFYAGDIDEFRIWNKELAAATIADWKDLQIDDTHPDWSNLIYYFQFNEEETSFEAINQKDPSMNGALIGAPGRKYFSSEKLGKSGIVGQVRPDIAFVQGTYTTHLDSTMTEVLIPHSGVTKVDFQVNGNYIDAVDTLNGWKAGYYYWYDEAGVLYDSSMTDPGTQYMNGLLVYYAPPFEVIDRYEIGRYITPYGIGLSLGSEGFRWVYDVTDYAYLLHDSVDLSAGNQQELIDLKFLMIEGTPPREVKHMDRIWGQRRSFKYSDMDNDVVMYDTTYDLHADATQWKVLTRLTGHGHNSNTGNYPHCCEWKDNTHYLYVNQQQVADWHIWQTNDCANNPVYPQGGTWPGAREGWCPGDVVKDNEFEITQYVSGNTVSIDYDITDVPSNNQGMGNGNYVVAMQLFHYGAANHALDAEIYEVLQPTDWEYRERWNPICVEPMVVLRNAGSTTLTSATFTYSVSGGTALTYNWTGNLAHMERTTVTLPVPDGSFWLGDGANNFIVNVSNPNGGSDEYGDNDSYVSHFEMPDNYASGGFVVYFQTNNRASENSYTIHDVYGNLVYERDNMTNNTLYSDTIYVWDGCYTFHFEDTGNDGLSYWADPGAGNGFLRLRKLTGGNLKIFKSEFGRDLHHAFSIGGVVNTPELDQYAGIEVYPNPGNGQYTLDITGIYGEVEIIVLDAMGRIVHSEEDVLLTESTRTIDISHERSGIYFFRFRHSKGEITKRLVRN